ncbi:diguanylate cyclase [Neptuniibacter caesariensis]|uniref:diguanylate cyclase n=1 Tax=Neptuniibacter caesariensis TaxID=207954 RepID=A0A7U8C6Q0_NEPCE|nr:diguanylate cyclase [Neptuniibacter caesariensis]EAR62513.1 probable two-component response regulator [Oceanospirillum sp. MED92] [Neptuniibacter caesariensis]
MLQYTVYADLNCPFCYALHEQLYRYGLLNQVDWRLVEHAPEIGIYNKSAESQAELASEVFVVRSRAPGIDVALPRFRSDSRFASLCVIEAEQQDTEKSIELRRRLYRALWVEGKDIADVSVIYDCLKETGLPTELDITEDQENQLTDWQTAWEEGNFNLRIPVICAEDGRVSLGLPSPEDLKAFFKGEDIISQEQVRESCPRAEQQTIAIFCDHGIEKIWPMIATLRNEFNILLPSSKGELTTLLAEDQPDLLLLCTEQQWQEMLSLCQEITANKDDYTLPVAFVSADLDDQRELDAYNAGAADFLTLNRAPAVLQSRIQILMQLKQSQDQLARSARVDGLTQVNNRREFERNIEMEWRRAQRSKRSLALIMLDIDHFKPFNDGYGHLAGDGCLRTVAQTIKHSIQRAQDMVCRYGGEEFVVILPETDLDGAQMIAERIRKAIAKLKINHEFSSTDNTITISAGVACLSPSQEGSPHELILLADQGLYQAKAQGRNQVAIVQTSE